MAMCQNTHCVSNEMCNKRLCSTSCQLQYPTKDKKESKYQESIQSSTTPDPGHHMGT